MTHFSEWEKLIKATDLTTHKRMEVTHNGISIILSNDDPTYKMFKNLKEEGSNITIKPINVNHPSLTEGA